MSLPKTVGTCADHIYKLDLEILSRKQKFDKEIAPLVKKRAELEEHSLGLLAAQRSTGAKGTKAQMERKKKTSYNIGNWDELWKFIVKTDSPDLVQRRLSSTAINSRLDNGIKVPGLKKFTRYVLSVRKL